MRRRFAVVSLIGVTACAGRPPGSVSRDDLVALADEIDPGVLSPLPAPAFLETVMGESSERFVEATARALEREDLESLIQSDIANMVALFVGGLALDRRLDRNECDTSCLVLLERLYGILDTSWISDQRGFLASMLGMLRQAAASDDPMATELLEYAHSIGQQAPARYRHVAARLLRDPPSHAVAARILEHLAASAKTEENFVLARRLITLQLAELEHEPSRAPMRVWLELAASCYRVYELPCGDDAILRAQAIAATPSAEEREQTASVTSLRTLAAQLQEHLPSQDIESELSRAELLRSLGRNRDARAIYERLRTDLPGDARPHTGLALLEWSRTRFTEAHAHIERSRGLENRDRTYFELGLAGAWLQVFPLIIAHLSGSTEDVMEGVLPGLPVIREMAQGLTAFDPGRSFVQLHIVDLAEAALSADTESASGAQALHETINHALRRLWAGRERFSMEPDVYRASYTISVSCSDRALVMDIVSTDVPDAIARRDEVLSLRDKARYRAAVTFADLSLLPSGVEAPLFRADIAMVRARLSGDRADWRVALGAAEQVLGEAEQDDRSRILNNIGVALSALGRQDEALARFEQSIDAMPNRYVPDLNRLVAKPLTDTAIASLEDLIDLAETGSVPFHADGWLASRASLTTGERCARQRNAEERFIAGDFIESMAVQRVGALGGSFQFQVGYSMNDRLVTNFDILTDTWFLIPAPLVTCP